MSTFLKGPPVELLSKMLSGVEWSGVGDTPQTVMTTRAPAVLKTKNGKTD